MTIKDTIKNELNQVLEKKYQLKDINFQVEYPPDMQMGDYSSNIALTLAKKLKKNPLQFGGEIIKTLNASKYPKEIFEKVEVIKPGFINFYLSQKSLKNKITEILKEKGKFGSSKIGKGKRVIIDYSAPNIAKNMHAGHLRSTIIGDSLARIFEFLGYQVISDNHLGDWGTQYGILLYEYKQRYGSKLKKGITLDELEGMYLDFMEKEKEEPKIRDAAKAELKKLQAKEKINYKLWKYFCKVSKKKFEGIYAKLKIRKFDLWNGESFYNKMLEDIVKSALEKKLAKESQGAIIVPLDKFNLPPGLIQKSDGTFLYLTTDLATLKYRHKKYHPDKILYVVANQQSLHLEQTFKISKLLELVKNEELIHIKFGLILDINGKKMSTRKGEVVKLDNLINKIIAKARKVIDKKNPDLTKEEKDKISEVVGIGALKYNDLSQNRLSDILFDWEKMLSFESGSAPYLQYTYVRIQSILKKSDFKPKRKNFKHLKERSEILLLRILNKFGEIVVQSAKEYKPNIIANYLEELAGNFHRYYEKVPIIKSEKEIQIERLALILAVAQTIKNGLDLLGIEVTEKM